MNNPPVIYCGMGLNERDLVCGNIKHHRPWVDHVVYVDGGSNDGTQTAVKALMGNDVKNDLGKSVKISLVDSPWQDNFPEQRNQYLKGAERWAKEHGFGTFFYLVSDPDEQFSEMLLKNVRMLVKQGIDKGINLFLIQCESVQIDEDGKEVRRNVDSYWKNLFFQHYEGIKYIGPVVHETLGPGHRWRPAKIGHPASYTHTKMGETIWLHGCRNAFIYGGGPNLGERQPLWRPFRQLVKKATGIDDWNSFLKYMRRGNIHPEIAEWIVKHRLEGVPPEEGKYPPIPEGYDGKRDENYDGASEIREHYKCLYRYLHPELEPEELRGTPIP